jgi:hypothetical protein
MLTPGVGGAAKHGLPDAATVWPVASLTCCPRTRPALVWGAHVQTA